MGAALSAALFGSGILAISGGAAPAAAGAAGPAAAGAAETSFKVRLNRLSLLDSGTSTIEISTEYASHLYDMYIRQHDGKHMTGDRMKILTLNLPFLYAGPTSS